MRKLIPTTPLALLLSVMVVFSTALRINHNEVEVSAVFDEDEFYRDLLECTTGIASIYATHDGRPLLWKNRDLGGGLDQEYHYIDDGRIPFISQAYASPNRRGEHYGGINAVGFAVENSNSYNLTHDVYIAGGDDDGWIMHLALATCRTVDDFQRILDSTNTPGRTLNSNYGAFDAFGGAAMFECSARRYERIDAVDYPHGFVVRSNYSIVGQNVDERQIDWGPNRHDRAQQTFKSGVLAGELSVKYIFQTVTRDLRTLGMTDSEYSVPYYGYVDNNPYGCIPNGESVCRSTTRSVMVAQGVRPNEDPRDGILWSMNGSQLSTVALPLWVRAGSVPQEFDGALSSVICDRSLQIRDYIYGGRASVNTFLLRNEEGTGFWDWAYPLEDWIFAKTEKFLNSPDFSYDKLELFQNQLAKAVYDSLKNWKPNLNVTEITVPSFWDNHLVFAWSGEPPSEGGDLQIEAKPQRFRVYHSEEPFREGENGTLIAELTEPQLTSELTGTKSGFFRVSAVY